MRRFLLVVVPALVACRVLDERHCSNSGGDATCREAGTGLEYCDRCVAAHDGCVAAPPVDPQCADEPTTGGTTDATTTTTHVAETTDPTDATTTHGGNASTSSAETTNAGSTSLDGTTDVGSTSLDATTDTTATGASSDETTDGPSCQGIGSICRADAECCSETCSALGLCV